MTPCIRLQLRTLVILALAIAPHAGVVAAQQPATDRVQQATQLITAGKFREAEAILDTVVTADPQNVQALMARGSAQRGIGHVDSAAMTFQYIYASFPPAAPRAALSLMLLYADAGRADDAYTWYKNVNGIVDLTAVAASPEVAKLTGDDRFNELFPSKSRYDNPFVEGTRIVQEWRGESTGDEFGWIARPVGDVDHDGVLDAVVSAPSHGPLGNGAGKIYVYSGKAGKLLWKRAGAPGALLGTGLESAGDVNRDGIPDVIAGAPGTNSALVLSGADGRTLLELKGDANEYYFGATASGVGDMNGDGYADVIVGAPYTAGKGRATGRAIVFSGKDGSRLLTLDGEMAGDRFGSTVGSGTGHQFVVGAPAAGVSHTGRVYVYDRLAAAPVFTSDASSSGAALGAMFVSVLGDIDGDHVPDIYATDFSDASKGPATGRVYVYSGRTGKTLVDLPGDVAGEGFGIGGGRTGDVDGDGIADLVVGSWQYSAAAWSGGRVRVLSGKDGRVLQTITGRVPGETLGFDAIGIGDVDGDGKTDYLITSAYSMVNGVRSGRTFIVAGTAARR